MSCTAWSASPAALRRGFFKDPSRGAHVPFRRFFFFPCRSGPQNGVQEEERGVGGAVFSPLLYMTADRGSEGDRVGRGGEGQPWLMWRLRGPKNIFPLPSILANVTCHMGHSLQRVCVCVCVNFGTIHSHFLSPRSWSFLFLMYAH